MIDLISSIFLERPRYSWRVVNGSSPLGSAEILPRKMTEVRAAKIAARHGVRLEKVILPKQTVWQELVEIGAAFLAAYAVMLPVMAVLYFLMKWLRHG